MHVKVFHPITQSGSMPKQDRRPFHARIPLAYQRPSAKRRSYRSAARSGPGRNICAPGGDGQRHGRRRGPAYRHSLGAGRNLRDSANGHCAFFFH